MYQEAEWTMTETKYSALSTLVDIILDHVGASEQVRWNTVEKGLLDEVVMTAANGIQVQNNNVYHIFGSGCEGTMTMGLQSDIDKLFYDADVPAVEWIPDGFTKGRLIINDGTTKPSYVKLQIVYGGIPLTSNIAAPTLFECLDQYGRICQSHIKFGSGFMASVFPNHRTGNDFESTGPAMTMSGTATTRDMDTVPAYRCSSVPSFTTGWINRQREHGWPTKQQLEKMSNCGCFLVGKGHPSSKTENLEWRISFSFQERELMFSFNSTQHKCYILLKMIKQDIISKLNVKSVSSYHLKTALFYTIENNPTRIWTPGNILQCIEICLKQLLTWLGEENCPNYFMPEENMFDRLTSDAMKKTRKLIQDIVESEGKYLLLLTCDKFGKLIDECMSGKILSNLSPDAAAFDLSSKMFISRAALNKKNRLVYQASKACPSGTLSALMSVLDQLKKSEVRLKAKNEFKEIEKALHLILPNIHLQIAQGLAAILSSMKDEGKKKILKQDFDKHIEEAIDSDMMSQRLISASLLYKENKLVECETVLTGCEASLKDYILTACTCTFDKGYNFTKLIERGNSTFISPLEFRRTCITSCLIFLPSHTQLAPTQLLYEQYRTVGANTDTLHPAYDYWFGLIAIDTKLYLFFLQYIIYTKLNKTELAQRAKQNLIHILETDIYLGHKDTGYNLLGWIYKQEKELRQATRCFVKSWRFRPDYNAAKWHMLVMMFENLFCGRI